MNEGPGQVTIVLTETRATNGQQSDTSPQGGGKRNRSYLFLLAITALAVLAILALLINIFERKQEARNAFYRVVDLNDEIEDPAIWGKNFPLQYDGYLRTVDQKRTRYGGSEAVPRTPDDADPRSIVAQSRLEEDPRLKTMWAGYAFSVDFREERGHAYMLEDQTYTQRQVVAKQPGTCMHCHASVYVPYRKLGNGDLIAGFEKMNQMPYSEARKLVTHPVACIDCHAPDTMQLRVTRPGFIEGIRALKASQGIAELRREQDGHAARRCAPTFAGSATSSTTSRAPRNGSTYPWDKGLKADQILAYYEENSFKDWTHAETGANVLKAQHPEFEMWNQGIHARSGVACADCHMPYKREGALKISDHHVRSPLLEYQPSVPDLPQMVRRGTEIARRDQSGTDLPAEEPGTGRGGSAHRRHQEQRRRPGKSDQELATARSFPPQSAVPSRFRGSGEFDGLSRAGGVRPASRAVN